MKSNLAFAMSDFEHFKGLNCLKDVNDETKVGLKIKFMGINLIFFMTSRGFVTSISIVITQLLSCSHAVGRFYLDNNGNLTLYPRCKMQNVKISSEKNISTHDISCCLTNLFSDQCALNSVTEVTRRSASLNIIDIITLLNLYTQIDGKYAKMCLLFNKDFRCQSTVSPCMQT